MKWSRGGFLAIFFICWTCQFAKADWAPGHAPLMTRWAAEVGPTNSHPEYPRPQLVRPDWLNLNGLWDYAIRPTTSVRPANFDGQILVPFPVESALSGVMKTLDENSALWYRRTVKIPPEWRGRRVRLNFGAADWQCRVFVNGREAGGHRGGYGRFAFDITGSLRWTNGEEIVVAVTDPTEADQPRGKQSRKPEGIFYTPTSGIWQTVWLEPVPDGCIDELRMTPDLDAKGLRLRVTVANVAEDIRVEATALDGTNQVGNVQGQANVELFLPIAQPKSWSPSDPFLYDLHVTLKRGDREVDRVSSYFGMRSVSLQKDDKGIPRIALNGQPFFELGTLDQGMWPDGIYTAPTDEALKYDLEFLKSAGFNLARKHVKIEPDRWYYWCDKLGLLVWQDMPSGNNATVEGQREFESELLHMVKDLYNHPSIIVWVLFNEGWGEYNTQRLTQRLKTLDSSRLVDNASGWADARVGDLADTHSYPGPSPPESESTRAVVLGEFGGLGLVMDGHSWPSSRDWAYRMEPDVPTLAKSYASLVREVRSMNAIQGLSAAVYTQTTDVETECNGLLTYDRTSKLNPNFLAEANLSARFAEAPKVIVEDATSGLPEWKYTFKAPETNWVEPQFNDADWQRGPAGFGTPRTPGAIPTTLWSTDDIWLRRKFVLGNEAMSGAKLEAHHDEDAEIYLNGVLAAKLPGYITHYDLFDILPDAAATLKPGANTMAVHCHQTTGGQYIDAGLVLPTKGTNEIKAGP
ncbi:MAG TPA: glycoside hydrolase family 2 TIM barrel-domain containing protein [Verrucomicrobiae bacterium]|nr:glycoside hydrolase family 2 TIM barrel-domain containing protein [Verrucomicrobiae bacterium]